MTTRVGSWTKSECIRKVVNGHSPSLNGKNDGPCPVLMTIRPIDIRRNEFKSSFKGYDPDQVDDFLDSVADEFERTYIENQRTREEISALRERLEQFERLEASIQTALVHAEEAANDLRASANQEAEDLRGSAGREAANLRRSASREAELILREAKARSHQMMAETSERVERVKESYDALREAKRLFTLDFCHVLRSYLEVLDKADVATAKQIEASLRERLDTESMATARQAAEQRERLDREGDSEKAVEADSGAGGEAVREADEQATVEQPIAVLASKNVEREESALAEEDNSEEFWKQEEEEDGMDSGSDGQVNHHIFRARRFLRWLDELSQKG